MDQIGPFTWDEAKRASNREKHGVDFSESKHFEMESAVVLRDDRKDYGEVRYRAFGPLKGRLHALVFTWRSGRIRIISLRRANVREINRYAKKEKTK